MKTGDVFGGSNAYLKAEDLKGKAVRVTIESVDVKQFDDGKKLVLHFVGKDKQLVCNRTNANRIEEATGTDETDNWEGWTIALYVCMVDFQGKRVPAIRVDDRPGATVKPARLQRREEPRGPVEHEDEPPPVYDDEVPF